MDVCRVGFVVFGVMRLRRGFVSFAERGRCVLGDQAFVGFGLEIQIFKLCVWA